MHTVLIDNQITTPANARLAQGDLWMPQAQFQRLISGSGQAEAIPGEHQRDGDVNASACWRHMNRPVLSSKSGAAWVFGRSAQERTAALKTLQAPDFTLPDLEGKPHSLSDYRGQKVFLGAWASW